MKIREYGPADAKDVARVISSTFERFNKRAGTKSALEEYLSMYSPDQDVKHLREMFEKTPIFYVATDGKNIVGMIRGTKRRIVNLFVLGEYHGKGIGKDLLLTFEREAKRQKTEFIKARASLYAAEFYRSQGYKKTTGIRNFRGNKSQPMIKYF